MSEIIHALIFLINVLLPSLDLILVYHKSTPHTTLQVPVLKFSLRSPSSLFTDPLFSLQSPSSARIKNRNCFARALAGVSKWTKRKIKQTMHVYRLGCILMFFFRRNPHLPTRGDPGEREGMKKIGRKNIFFPLSIHPPRLNFLSPSLFAMENVFSVIPRKWAIYATARARDGQKFEDTCHLFDCLRLYTSGPGSWKADHALIHD